MQQKPNFHIYQCHNVWVLRNNDKLIGIYQTLDKARQGQTRQKNIYYLFYVDKIIPKLS